MKPTLAYPALHRLAGELAPRVKWGPKWKRSLAWLLKHQGFETWGPAWTWVWYKVLDLHGGANG